MAIDAAGNAYIVGSAQSDDPDFPLVNPIQAVFASGVRGQCNVQREDCGDAIILKLNATGSALLYSTYLGGGGTDYGVGIAVDNSGNAYVTGVWSSLSPSLPATGPRRTFFLIKLADAGMSPMVVPAGVTDAASFESRRIAGGGLATVFGANLTNVQGILTAQSLPLPTELGGSSVLLTWAMNTVVGFGLRYATVTLAAPILAVANVNGQQQINFQVPPIWPADCSNWATCLLHAFDVSVSVVNNGAHSVPVAQVFTRLVAPAIFTTDGTRGAIEHGRDFRAVTPFDPAARGEAVVIYATGLGPVEPEPGAGQAASRAPLSVTLGKISVTVGGKPARVLFSGLAPGFVGLNQVNIEIPADAPSGDDDVIITASIDLTGIYPIRQDSKPVKLAVQ